MEGFLKETIDIIDSLEANSSFCFGQKGIALSPSKSQSVYGFSQSGIMIETNEKSKNRTRTARFKVEKDESFAQHNTMTLSPSGRLILVSFCFKRTIFILNSKNFKVLSKIQKRRMMGWLKGVKWVSETRFLGFYYQPAFFEVFDVSRTKALMKIGLSFLSAKTPFGCGLNDVLIYDSGKSAICAGIGENSENKFLNVVLKADLTTKGTSESELVVWDHFKHGSFIRLVRMSKCSQYVLSGGWDHIIIIAREKDGVIIHQTSGFGLIFSFEISPDQNWLMVQTCQQIALAKWTRNSENDQEIQKIDQIPVKDFHNVDLDSLGVNWVGNENQKAHVLIGESSGRVLKVSFQCGLQNTS